MPREIVPGVEVDPRISFGKPVIGGTRVPVATVLEELASGASSDEICGQYDLAPEQIRAALRYAAQLAEEEGVRRRAS